MIMILRSKAEDIIKNYNVEKNSSSRLRAKNLVLLLDNFDSFIKYIIDKDYGIKYNENEKDNPYHKIHKSLKWNLFVCIYNLYLENPVLGLQDYKKESISYLNNLIYNYFDFCNFNDGNDNENNKKYFCDLLDGLDGVTYNPKRSQGYIHSSNFTT